MDELIDEGTFGFGVPCGIDLDVGEEVGRVWLEVAGFEVEDAVQDVDAVEGRGVPEPGGAVLVPNEDVVDPVGRPFELHVVGEDFSYPVFAWDVASEVGVVEEEVVSVGGQGVVFHCGVDSAHVAPGSVQVPVGVVEHGVGEELPEGAPVVGHFVDVVSEGLETFVRFVSVWAVFHLKCPNL